MAVYAVQDKKTIASLFDGWDETMIYRDIIATKNPTLRHYCDSNNFQFFGIRSVSDKGVYVMERKTAVVTGGSSGIGQAITTTLLNNSYNVLANGRSIHSVYKDTDNLLLNKNDMLLPETSQMLLNDVLDRWGKCDVLFVNAGMIESNNIEDINIDKMCEMVRLKVEMSYRIIYTFLKYFLTTETGHIIITSSVMGTKTRENSGAYTGCNFALEALAESLRMELANTDIKITCIEPGLVETNLHSNWEIKPKELLNISNALIPQDIADAVVEILEKPSHIRIPRYMIMPKGHRI